MDELEELKSQLEALRTERARMVRGINRRIQSVECKIEDIEQQQILTKCGLSIGDKVYLTDEWNLRRERNNRIWFDAGDTREWTIISAYVDMKDSIPMAESVRIESDTGSRVSIPVSQALELRQEWLRRNV